MGFENETFTTVSYRGTQNYNQFKRLSQNIKKYIHLVQIKHGKKWTEMRLQVLIV